MEGAGALLREWIGRPRPSDSARAEYEIESVEKESRCPQTSFDGVSDYASVVHTFVAVP